MLALRTPRKSDFFESRIEPKPKENLAELTQAVEALSQEILECDQEIERWQWKKSRIKSHVKKVAENAKVAL